MSFSVEVSNIFEIMYINIIESKNFNFKEIKTISIKTNHENFGRGSPSDCEIMPLHNQWVRNAVLHKVT